MTRRGVIVWLAAAVASIGIHAQTPATFDVASVKANKTGATQVTISWQGGVTIINVPLRAIVQLAYNINTPSRIVGHLDWTNVERFDIQARPPEGMTAVEQMRPMLRALLEDRFKLVAKIEKRELQSYALVKARTDGQLGANLKPSRAVCKGPRGEASPLAIQCGVQGGVAGAAKLVGVPIGQLAPSIFTALQEQLGLKLDAEREVAEVLVIERIDRPAEN